jgi:tetratricopeptide (TPR) repeat protein
MRRTRAGWLLLCFLTAVWGFCLPAAAQEPEVIHLDPNQPLIQNPGTSQPQGAPSNPPEVVPLPAQGVNAREVLAGLWFRYQALLERGDVEGAGRQVSTALEFMKREGLQAAPEIAAAFLSKARQSLVEGDYHRSSEFFRLAARFDPALTAAHFGLALALLRGDRDLPGAVREWWAGVRRSLSEPESAFYEAGNGFLLLYLGLCFGGCVALVLLVLRHAPAFFHDLKERSSGRLSEGGSRLLGWCLLALPVIAMAPVAWALAFWGAIVFTYLRRPERWVAAVILLLLGAAGPVVRLVGWHFGTAADPAARALIQAGDENYSLTQVEPLKQLARDHPGETIFPFLLASVYRAAGRADDAIALYGRVLEIDPGETRALVNLGNLYFLRQDFPVALSKYHRASESDPRFLLPHYNSHLAHLEAFHLEAADEELGQARRIDDTQVTRLMAREAQNSARRTPIDARLTKKEIWTQALRLRLERGLRSEFKEALGAPATLAGGAGLIAALLLPGLGLAPRSGAARRCRRCGGPFCRRCQVATKYPDHCSQCMHLFILRDGLAPGVKNRKMEEVARYRRKIFIGTRCLSLVLPGSGHLLGGRALVGAATLMAWAVVLLAILARGALLVSPEWIAPTTGATAVLPLVGLGLIVWLLGNLSHHEAVPE